MGVWTRHAVDPSEAQHTARRVLGVSAYYHDSAAALIVDGVIVAAAQEERFTRTKGCADLPEKAIEWVLTHGGLEPEQLDAVVFYENPFLKLDRILSSHLLGRPKAGLSFLKAMRSWLPSKLWVQRDLQQLLSVRTDVLFCDHHLAHAASAFYPSPFEEAAVLTVDGVGEWSTTMIAHGCRGEIKVLEDIEFPNSLGLLYSAFTVYCGFKVNSGEYKLMGLAPYGSPRFVDLLLEELVHLDDDGSFSLNPVYFEYFGGERTFNRRFEQLLGAPARSSQQPISQFHADVAASIQQVCNLVLANLARRAAELTGSKHLCLAGGVALNVVSVGYLERLGLFDEIWVQPAAGDAGGALGAAAWASHELLGVPRVVLAGDAMSGGFLGPEPGFEDTVDSLLQSYGLVSDSLDEEAMAVRVAELIDSGMVVGVARGRMEFGPRALGARSILADARVPGMQARLNEQTKRRESFRPFAPVVLAEHADDYFTLDGRESPYMLKAYHLREHHRIATTGTAKENGPGTVGTETIDTELLQVLNRPRSELQAVTHVDFSARVQTVDGERNPFLHMVLREFEARTGCAVMVNTSLNVRGEPIVCSARDAIECFLATDLDALVLDDHLLLRSQQDPDNLSLRRHPWGGDD